MSGRTKQQLESIIHDMLSAMGEPDWRYTNGFGMVQFDISAKTYVRWAKSVGFETSIEAENEAKA